MTRTESRDPTNVIHESLEKNQSSLYGVLTSKGMRTNWQCVDEGVKCWISQAQPGVRKDTQKEGEKKQENQRETYKTSTI